MSTVSQKLAALRSQFGDQPREERAEGHSNNYFPFWNMKAGQRAVIRFLPDANKDNPRQFLVEKLSHKLTVNGQSKNVPCMSMYEEDCPICKVSQEYYRANDKVNGKKYWKSKQHLAQVVVIEDPLPPDPATGETHQGQVRRIAIGHQLYTIIKEAFASVDDPLDEVPYDFKNGYDFIIKKTEQGEYSTYALGSKFHSKSRSLTDGELTKVQEGLIDLSTLLPRKPDVASIQAMLNADLTGEVYADGNPPAPPRPAAISHKTPAIGTNDPYGDDKQPSAPPSVSVKVESAPASNPDVDAMLAQIQARRAAKKST